MTDPDVWEDVARGLATASVDEDRLELQIALHELAEDLSGGKEITPEHVNDVRDALRHAQYVNEEYIAPLAGVEPWERCFGRVPLGAIWKTLGYRPTETEPIEN